jgi:hypothetical protein
LMTLANAPLSARDGRLSATDLPDGESQIFLRMGMDRRNRSTNRFARRAVASVSLHT